LQVVDATLDLTFPVVIEFTVLKASGQDIDEMSTRRLKVNATFIGSESGEATDDF